MNTVEVGQKVRINDECHFYLNKGDIVEVTKLDRNPQHFWIEAHEDRNGWNKGDKICVHLDNVDFDNPPTLKNKQRIAALEKEVAELKAIVHELRKNTSPEAVVEVVESIKERSKTPNQQRKEIIEKAKQFVEKNSKGFHDRCPLVKVIVGLDKAPVNFDTGDKLEFIENEEKRTVVALIRFNETVYHKGVAKCMKDDVFNIHIGRAIALGKALGKDVSEFMNAVKPNEKAVGQLVEVVTIDGITSIAEIMPENRLCYVKCGNVALGSYYANIGTIIDDTKAVYE